MERNSKENIVILLEDTIQLLKENQNEWAPIMEILLDNYANLTHSKTKKEAAIND